MRKLKFCECFLCDCEVFPRLRHGKERLRDNVPYGFVHVRTDQMKTSCDVTGKNHRRARVVDYTGKVCKILLSLRHHVNDVPVDSSSNAERVDEYRSILRNR